MTLFVTALFVGTHTFHVYIHTWSIMIKELVKDSHLKDMLSNTCTILTVFKTMVSPSGSAVWMTRF